MTVHIWFWIIEYVWNAEELKVNADDRGWDIHFTIVKSINKKNKEISPLIKLLPKVSDQNKFINK